MIYPRYDLTEMAENLRLKAADLCEALEGVEWVDYKEHLAAIEELQRENARLMALLDPAEQLEAIRKAREQGRQEEREAFDFLPHIEFSSQGFCPVCYGSIGGYGRQMGVHTKGCRLAAAVRVRGVKQ